MPTRSRSQPQVGLGRAVRALRVERGQTQEDLAHAAELTTAALARIERGEVNPSWATVRRIASGLQVTVAIIAVAADEHEASL